MTTLTVKNETGGVEQAREYQWASDACYAYAQAEQHYKKQKRRVTLELHQNGQLIKKETL